MITDRLESKHELTINRKKLPIFSQHHRVSLLVHITLTGQKLTVVTKVKKEPPYFFLSNIRFALFLAQQFRRI